MLAVRKMSAAAAPAIKLTYFPILGRAFPIRTALGAAGLAYEDERIGSEALAERRGSAGYSDAVPLGQLPVISIDGKIFTQSWAILRWAVRGAPSARAVELGHACASAAIDFPLSCACVRVCALGWPACRARRAACTPVTMTCWR